MGGPGELGGAGAFDFYFCGVFDCHCLSLISLVETEPVQQLVKHLVYQVYYTRYEVSFYLWLTRPALKHFQVPKYYGQDCSYRKKRKS